MSTPLIPPNTSRLTLNLLNFYNAMPSPHRPHTRAKAVSLFIASLSWQAWAHAQQTPETAPTLPSVEVKAQSGPRYAAPAKISANRTGLSAEETPKNIQVYNREAIDDTQPDSIADVVTRSANVVNLGNNDGRENNFVVRGFIVNNATLVDGFKPRRSIANPELFNLQQVEVLKGADSVLYGASEPGGSVSIVNKRPQAVRHASIETSFTSENGFSPKLDVGGPLNQDASVRYRLVGVYNKESSWRNFTSDSQRIFLAPSLSIDLTRDTQLTVYAEHTDDKKPNDMGTAIDGNGRPVTSTKVVNSHPDERFTTDQSVLGADLNHRLSNTWSVQARLRHQRNNYAYSELWLPTSYTAPNYSRVPANQSLKGKETLVQVNLSGDVMLQGMRHRITTGLDHSQAEEQIFGCFDPTTTSQLNVFNPVYTAPIPACDTTLLPNSFDYGAPHPDKVTRKGIFLLDTITLTEQLNASLGLRHEQHKQTNGGGAYSSATDAKKWLPQVGLNYTLNPAHALYAAYSESFNPATTRDQSGNFLPPEEGQGIELGLKSKWLQGQLTGTLALFDVKKKNVSMADPLNALFSVASGKQRSRGVEYELRGNLSKRTEIMASVGLLDTKDLGNYPGKSLISAPKQTLSLWWQYSLTPEWRISADIKHVGRRYATYDNTVRLPAHTLLNLGAEYATQGWTTRLSLQNVSNKVFIDNAWGGTARSVTPGAPRKLLLAVRRDF